MLLGNFDEQRALELAIEQEEILEAELRRIAARIDDPAIRAIYEANANSTHGHALLVTEDVITSYSIHYTKLYEKRCR